MTDCCCCRRMAGMNELALDAYVRILHAVLDIWAGVSLEQQTVLADAVEESTLMLALAVS